VSFLSLDVSLLQQQRELPLDLSVKQESVLPLDVSALHTAGLKLLDSFDLQRPMLPLIVCLFYGSLCSIWTCLVYSSLCCGCPWKFLFFSSLAVPGQVDVYVVFYRNL
jgi:hypothetical protein